MQPPRDDDTVDLLAPAPAVRTGGLVGYARVSTKGQLLDRQVHALTEAGCILIFSDKKSGKNAEREELRKALDQRARASGGPFLTLLAGKGRLREAPPVKDLPILDHFSAVSPSVGRRPGLR